MKNSVKLQIHCSKLLLLSDNECISLLPAAARIKLDIEGEIIKIALTVLLMC